MVMACKHVQTLIVACTGEKNLSSRIPSSSLSPLSQTPFQKDDEVMASMLADFVDCPPDDEDHSASQSQP